MSEINTLKLQNLNSERKKTQRSVSNAISQLNTAADTAMRQQAYMKKNPDNNGADQLIAVVHPDFLAAASAFNLVAQKLQDMQLVSSGDLSVDDFMAKYNIDLTEFSNGLI